MAKDTVLLVGVMEVVLLARGSHSLKEKRRIVRSLRDHIRNKFNVSVAEVGGLDKWQRIVFGVSAVANNKRFLEEELSKVINLIRTFPQVELVDYTTEFF